MEDLGLAVVGLDLDTDGVRFAQGQSTAAHFDFDWITKRCNAHNREFGSTGQAHGHQLLFIRSVGYIQLGDTTMISGREIIKSSNHRLTPFLHLDRTFCRLPRTADVRIIENDLQIHPANQAQCQLICIKKSKKLEKKIQIITESIDNDYRVKYMNLY